MNNVVNLTKNYIETVSAMKKEVILVIVFSLVIGIFDPRFIVYGVGVSVSFLLNQVLSYEDISGIDFLIAVLPIKKKEYVISRYICGFIVTIIATLLVTLSYFAVYLINKTEMMLPYSYFLVVSIISSIIIISVNIPVFLKYGTLKSRYISTLLNLSGVFLPMLMIEGLSRFNILSGIISNPIILVLSLLLLGFIIVCVSYFISIKLYEGKEVKK